MAYCVYPSIDSGAVTHFIALAAAGDPAMFLTFTVIGSGSPPAITLSCGTGASTPLYNQGATTFSFDGKNVDITYADVPATAPAPALGRRYQLRFVLDPGTTLEMINRTVWSISFAGIAGQSFAFVVADNQADSYHDVATPLVAARSGIIGGRDLLAEIDALKARITLNPPIGSIVAFGGEVSPSWEEKHGWMLCNGRRLDRTKPEHQALFDAIGYGWGGSGGEFALPDLQGRLLRGVDPGAKRDVEAAKRDPSQPGGNTGARVGSVQGPATGAPRNPDFGVVGGPHRHQLPTYDGQGGAHEVGSGHYGQDFIPAEWTATDGDHTHTVKGWDSETRPHNAAVFFLIRYK